MSERVLEEEEPQSLVDLRHDLRTPIGHVLGYGEMVVDELRERGQTDLIPDVEKMRGAGLRLLAMISERLNVTALGLTGAPLPPSLSDKRGVQVKATKKGDLPAPNKDLSDAEVGLLLVVDDNEDNREVLARRLQKQGHWVVTAASGAEALAAASGHIFDLVLLDIMMPEMDGYEVLARLKADPTTQNIPVVMISALDEMDSVVRCLHMGAADYLPKPFNPTLLQARVTASLREKRAHDRELRFTELTQESYRRLQELESMRDDLTHMIIHDLRTPLTSLMGGLNTVPLLGELNETQREMLEIALTGGQTLLGMVNDLLDVEKLEQNSMPLDRTKLTAEGLIARALAQVSALGSAGGVTLRTEIAPDVPEFSGDEDKLRRTLVNLLGNAIKFTPEGGFVTVSAQYQPDEESIRFAVSDTGEGIPPEAFGQIFEKFGQVASRKRGRKMSTGLGLAFCKLAVEAHGGQIGVSSVLGEGSEFFFTIPAQSV